MCVSGLLENKTMIIYYHQYQIKIENLSTSIPRILQRRFIGPVTTQKCKSLGLKKKLTVDQKPRSFSQAC